MTFQQKASIPPSREVTHSCLSPEVEPRQGKVTFFLSGQRTAVFTLPAPFSCCFIRKQVILATRGDNLPEGMLYSIFRGAD